MRTKLLQEYAKHRPAPASEATIRQLLESSYLTNLGKIIRNDAVWPSVGDRLGSKRQLTDNVSDPTAFRNPMAHNRSVSETWQTPKPA